MRPHWILFLIIVASSTISFEGLRLVNNGYEDLYIVIKETVSEDPQLLDRIQEIFRDASILLYRATQKRAYFKKLKVIVPKTWTKYRFYKTASALPPFTSHIRIGNKIFIPPITIGSGECGQEGLYTYFDAKEFVLKKGTTRWGPHDSVIVHEWGHLRWGLKDEYPTIKGNSGNVWRFYQANGRWNPVGCTRNIEGYASKTCKYGEPDDEECDLKQSDNFIGRHCKFCPTMKQPLNASLMAYQFIPAISEFCDKDDPDTPEHLRHNTDALNEQNKNCGGKSAWEVMREHNDFKNNNNLPLNDDFPPQTEFVIEKETTDKVRVLVLDTSGSMENAKLISALKI